MNFSEEHRQQMAELERIRSESLKRALQPFVERLAQTKSEAKIRYILLANIDNIKSIIDRH
jgi:hypothetical protein